MEPNEFIKLLGLSSTHGEIESILRRFGIKRRPKLQVDEEDADGPIVEVQDWVINSRVGIEFGFEDEASLLGLERLEFGAGPMILKQIYLYGEHQGVNVYQGSLPFGLNMEDDRKTVRNKLSKFETLRRSYVRDTWVFSGYKMAVSYVDEDKRIGFIILMYNPNIPPKLELVQNTPKIGDIIQALGKPKDDPLVGKLFSPFGLNRRLEDNGQEYVANFRENFGFQVRFRKHIYSGKSKASIGLSHITFYRDREMEARGYRGRLPNSIDFNDSPEMLFKKIDHSPDNITDDLFVGFALWHLDEYSLRVKYSTMDNFILSVDLLAPGIWEAYSAG